MALVGTPVEDDVLATFDVSGVGAECGFDSIQLPRTEEDDYDESYAITIRLTVVDSLGNVAVSRRNVTVHHDATLLAGFPIDLGVSGDSAPVLVDMDADGAQEIVIGTAAGEIHVLDAGGVNLPGWPVTTELLPLVSGSPTFAPEALGSAFHSAILAPVAVGDLDGDGGFEVVAADMDGSVYAFHDDGSAVAGFPVTLEPGYSDASIRDKANRVDFAVMAAPTLADLDADGDLEILVAGLDRHLYVWDHDGSTHAGFPVLIVDQERMASVDATTHQVVWKTSGGQPVGSIGTKLVGSPSVGDLDGDGDLEIVIGSNEEYVRDESANFALNHSVFNILSLSLDLPNGRLYALSHLGNDDPAVAQNPSGPFLDGWPVRIGLLLKDLLPSVGHGVTAAAVLADVDDDGDDEVFAAGNNGPAYLLEGDGTSKFGVQSGSYRIFDAILSAVDNPGASSGDFPLSFSLLGGGAAGDLLGDGTVEFAMPAVGTTQLLDAQGPAVQGPGDHQMMAWSSSGASLPDFPQKVEDMQFLASPAVSDVDGDAVAELLAGSGGYYLHAFSGDGGEPTTWPKFTGGWMVGSAAPGDIDGDGSVDVVAVTREGKLFAWSTTADYDTAAAPAVQWATLGHDRQRTGSLNSGVSASEGAGCTAAFRAVIEKVSMRLIDGAANDTVSISGFANTLGRDLGVFPWPGDASVDIGGPDDAPFSVLVSASDFKTNKNGTRYKYTARPPGLTKLVLKNKRGRWAFTVKAKNVDATPSDAAVFLRIRTGSTCLERTRTCEFKAADKALKCAKPK